MEAQPSVPNRLLVPGEGFESGLSFSGWFAPVVLGWAGAFAILIVTGRSERTAVDAAALVPVAAGLVLMVLTRVEITDGQLCVSTRGIRRRCIYLYGLRSVTTRPSRWNIAPTLVLVALDGTRLDLQLGSWRDEEDLVEIIYAAARRAKVTIDQWDLDVVADVPYTRPPGMRYRRWRGGIRGGEQMTPRGLIVLAIVLAIGLAGVYGISRVAGPAGDFVGGLLETSVFPKHVDPAWVDRFEIPTGPIFTWPGNVAAVGKHIALATEDDIEGFWGGTVRVRTSDDGGRTWSAGVDVSGPVNTAGETLVAAPNGTLTVAWTPESQRLVVRRSRDGGVSWTAPAIVAIPEGGLLGEPVIVTTDTVAVIAYTDGDSGDIWAQPLTRDGAADGHPALVASGHRPVVDGLLSITATGSRIALASVRDETAMDNVRVSISDDGGRHWREASIWQRVEEDLSRRRPRIASDGSTLLLAAIDPGEEPYGSRYGSGVRYRPFVAVQMSHDGGETWQPTKALDAAPRIGGFELVRSAGMWRVLWASCPGKYSCVAPDRIWYTTSRDGLTWTENSVVTDLGSVAPLSVIADDTGASAIWWSFQGPDARLIVSRRNE